MRKSSALWVLLAACSAGPATDSAPEPVSVRTTSLSAWQVVPGTMLLPASEQSMVLLGDGRVLSCGGWTGFSSSSLCMAFDPWSGAWEIHSILNEPRRQATLSALPSGDVLACGGETSGCELLSAGGTDWSATASMSVARTGATATVLGSGRVLMAGGDTQGTAELYDPATGTFAAAGTTVPRSGATATLLGDGRVLLAGGEHAGVARDDVEIYDPASPQWKTVAPLPAPRVDHTATRLRNGRVLVAGGSSGSDPAGSAWLFDEATESWLTLSSTLWQARRRHAAALLPSGKVLIAGGRDAAATVASAEIFDPATQTFGTAPSLAEPREGASAVVFASGAVLVAGGGSNGNPLASAEVYTSVEPAWTDGPQPPADRILEASVRMPSGRVLIIGGWTGTTMDDVWAYDPVANQFEKKASMGTPRLWHTATLLLDGRVLVAGGSTDFGNSMASSEIYDPVSDTWTPAGAMPSPRMDHTAELLPDGSVMAVCGDDYDGYSAVRFDPATSSWSAVASTLGWHASCRAMLLDSGKVLLVGFEWPELYDPVADQWADAGLPSYDLRGAAMVRTPDGRVMLAGGVAGQGSATNETVSFDPETGDWRVLAPMPVSRSDAASLMLPDGRLFVAGGAGALSDEGHIYNGATDGWESAGTHPTLESLYVRAHLLSSGQVLAVDLGVAPSVSAILDRGLGQAPGSKPVIASHPSHVAPGTAVVVTGSRFRGDSEAYGGTSTGAASDLPLVSLVSLDGQAAFFLPVSDASAGTIRLEVPSTIPRGYYAMTVMTAGVPSDNTTLGVRGAEGDLCDAGAGCLSGHCVDGVCCASATCGECQACDVAGSEGTCANLPQGAQTTTCVAPLVCDGGGQCLPGPGQACTNGAACSTGHCFDGVCCETACDAPCMSCAMPGSEGVCSPLPVAAQDLNPPGACLAPSACNGVGDCRPGAGTPCITETDCGTGYCVDGVCCSGPCSAMCYGCAVAGSEGTCTLVPADAEDPPQCEQGQVCDGAGQCRLADAQSCADGSVCASGFCVGGVCCDTACGETCWSCTLPGTEGVCSPVPAGAASVGCDGQSVCDGEGACKLGLGSGCTAASQCASGFCADGVCCDQACTGQCEACDVASQAGTCLPIDGDPRPSREPCAGAQGGNECSARTCLGSESRTTCEGFVGVEQVCRDASCENGMQVLEARCDGEGGCPAVETRACQLYVCGETACKTSCESDDDCADPEQFECDSETKLCVPREGTTCEDDHTVLTPEGERESCFPYRCESGASGAICSTSCASTLDCAEGYVCDLLQGQGTCVQPTDDAGGDASSEGCGCKVAGRSGRGGALWLGVVLAIGLLRRRRTARVGGDMDEEDDLGGAA